MKEQATNWIDLGPTVNLVTNPDPYKIKNNFVLIHRNSDFFMQWWGNYCSKIVTKLSLRGESDKPYRWYHKTLFNFCYAQYDKYGDYYRLIDFSWGNPVNDETLEVR